MEKVGVSILVIYNVGYCIFFALVQPTWTLYGGNEKSVL